jgi:hypothetical protein
MRKRGRFVQINAANDKRSKSHRILQAYGDIASEGRLFVRPEHLEFLQQFVGHQPGGGGLVHDDVLDAGAMAIDEAKSTGLELDPAVMELVAAQQAELPELDEWRACP